MLKQALTDMLLSAPCSSPTQPKWGTHSQWPAIDRDAKDQVIEKKIRCVFLPPVERAVPPATEGGIEYTVSSVEFVEEDDPESPSTHQPARSSHDSESSPSSDDIHVLKRELESAQGIIRTLREALDKVQNEANVVSRLISLSDQCFVGRAKKKKKKVLCRCTSLFTICVPCCFSPILCVCFFADEKQLAPSTQTRVVTFRTHVFCSSIGPSCRSSVPTQLRRWSSSRRFHFRIPFLLE